jgi:hypothetical protein
MDCWIIENSFASMQQSARFLCKQALPGQHRLEAHDFINSPIQKSITPFFCSARVVQ